MTTPTVLILAGGVSERFGRGKAFFEIAGRPMIDWVVKEVSKLSGEIVIACKSGSERFAEMFPKAVIVVDKHEGKGAPVGLVSSLPEVSSEYVVLVTCDCPKIKSEVIELLLGEARGHDGAVPIWPNGYIEPLQAVYRTKKLQKVVEDAWKSKKMRMAEVLMKLRDIVYVETEKLRKVDPKLESFTNVNSPEDIGRCFEIEKD